MTTNDRLEFHAHAGDPLGFHSGQDSRVMAVQVTLTSALGLQRNPKGLSQTTGVVGEGDMWYYGA